MRSMEATLESASTRPKDSSEGAGFSLVDTMVALLLMALAVLSLGAAFPLATFAVQHGIHQTQAAAIAERVFDQMRAATYGNINAANFPNRATVPGYPAFSYTIVFGDGTPVANTRRVTITVTYPFQGEPVSVSFTTIFAKPT